MISVVIPARNEEETIGRVLESIFSSTFSDYEVIVVDGDSSDRTVEIAEDYGARVIQGPQEGPAVARNVGWRAADGDVIYFLDADRFIGEENLEKVSAAFEQGSKVVNVLPRDEKHVTQGWVSKTLSAEMKATKGKNSRAKLVRGLRSLF